MRTSNSSRVNTLGNRVGCAQLLSDHAVDLCLGGAANEDRCTGSASRAKDQAKGILVGQHEIENNGIGLCLGYEGARWSAPVAALIRR